MLKKIFYKSCFCAFFMLIFATLNTNLVQARTISDKKMTITAGYTEGIGVTGVWEWGAIKWKSTNTKVATVDKYGLIEGVKAGKATIVGTYGGKQYKCKVTVAKHKNLTVKKATLASAKKVVKVLNNKEFMIIKIKAKSETKAKKILSNLSKKIAEQNKWKVGCQFYSLEKIGKNWKVYVTPSMGERYRLAKKYVKKSYDISIAEWRQEIEDYKSDSAGYESDPNIKYSEYYGCSIDTPYSELSDESRLLFAQPHKFFAGDAMMTYSLHNGNIEIFGFGLTPYSKRDTFLAPFTYDTTGPIKFNKIMKKTYKKLINQKAKGVCQSFVDVQWMLNDDLNFTDAWYVLSTKLSHTWCIIKTKNSKNETVYYLSDNGYITKINSEKDLKNTGIGSYVSCTKKEMGKSYPF